MRDEEILDKIFIRLRELEQGKARPIPQEETNFQLFKKLRLLEKRTDKLEAWKYKLIGIATGVGIAVHFLKGLL